MNESDYRFCPTCDYATSVQQVAMAVVDLSCPRCGDSKLSDFYEIGSYTHRKRREEWDDGLISGAPLPVSTEMY